MANTFGSYFGAFITVMDRQPEVYKEKAKDTFQKVQSLMTGFHESEHVDSLTNFFNFFVGKEYDQLSEDDWLTIESKLSEAERSLLAPTG